MGKLFVVRVVLFEGQMEQYEKLLAAFVAVHLIQIHRQDDWHVCFDILPPASTLDTKEWADMAAHVLAESGFNAVAAPAWIDNDRGPCPNPDACPRPR